MKADKIVGANMMRKFLRNRKGTAEVIGSVMFIVILLFFFTNVYLWHDAATKEMNQLYVDKINTPVRIDGYSAGQLTVTNTGGMDTTISRVWLISGSGPSQIHAYNDPNTLVSAGKQTSISGLSVPAGPVLFKVVTTTGNIATYQYTP